MPVVLTELKVRGSHRDSEGFVSIDEIYAAAQALGFSPAQIHQCLDRAEEKRLLERRRVTSVEGGEAGLRITPLGAYSVERLIRLFVYIDAIVTDTPVVDATYRGRIAPAQSIADRVLRAEWFRSYLDKVWNGLGGHRPSFEWSAVSADLRDDIWNVGRRVDPDRWPR